MYNQKPLLGTLINWGHPLSKGLVGAWLFNENSGNKIFDLSFNGNHGTFGAGAAAPTWGYGRTGPAIDFDGSDSINCSGTAHLNLTNAITIVTGLYPQNLTSYKGIVYKGNQNTGWNLTLKNDKIYSEMNIGTNPYAYTGSSNSLVLNKWANIVIVYDGSKILSYINGIKDTNEVNATGILKANTITLQIGTWANVYYFTGTINDVKIYNRALNASEIMQLYTDPYCWLAQPMEAELMYAAPPVGVMSPYYYETLMTGAVI